MGSLQSSNGLVRALVAVTGAQRQWRILLGILIAVVCYLAVSPAPPKQIDLGWDKLNHISAFAALTWTGCLAFPHSRRELLWVLVGMLALGGLIEVVQYFVPGRSSDWLDLGADAIGMVIGLALAQAVLKLVRRASSVPA